MVSNLLGLKFFTSSKDRTQLLWLGVIPTVENIGVPYNNAQMMGWGSKVRENIASGLWGEKWGTELSCWNYICMKVTSIMSRRWFYFRFKTLLRCAKSFPKFSYNPFNTLYFSLYIFISWICIPSQHWTSLKSLLRSKLNGNRGMTVPPVLSNSLLNNDNSHGVWIRVHFFLRYQ